MATQKPRISLGDFASLWIAASCAIFIGSATFAVLCIDNDAIIHFFSKPFYPGFYIAYRMMSGYSDVSDRVADAATLAAAFTNAFVYSCGVVIVRLLWRYLKEPTSLRSGRLDLPSKPDEDR